MLGYALRRVMTAIPIVLLTITVCFFILRLAPGGPFDGERALPPDVLKNLRAHYNLDQPLIVHKRQVNARLHALEVLGGLPVDLHHAAVGQHQLRAFVAGVDALRLATAQDQPLAVHDIDVARQNGHRPINDILRQVMVEFEHCGVL